MVQKFRGRGYFFFVALLVACFRYAVSHSTNKLEQGTVSRPLASGISLEDCPRTLSTEPCYWKPTWDKSRWQRRIHLDDLKVGQKLVGYAVEELLDGKTGPKMFFEVGVGRTDTRGRWNIVNGMLRMDRAKESVIRKRASRLRKKDSIELWVSRVQKGCGRLEVCLDEEDVRKYQGERKVPVSSLKKGDDMIGKVVRLHPYGVMVDVGANRLGLLHILKVRSLYGKFIDGEKGLIEAGLERGAKVRLSVESVEKRRLSLDFTDDVKKEAEVEQAEKKSMPDEAETSATGPSTGGMSVDELEEWAAFASLGESRSPDVQSPIESKDEEKSQNAYEEDLDDEGDDGDDYDDYDEERDIEDSLGLGYY
eukprot:CAMPEP_0176061176 /NCGR_PEP_ID=MMETSP0120_2-20121206/30499_1 /TAXON_ID=160619 /ORGANISM="Kryptoperidinium foliaceum, Strain CCMP 1326" /LENGTH=364 /DNA_ID=CAMNT_0017394731 /DNA_START=159 /DNA_END=1253 /DNA_ORIENTATION=+